VQNVETLPPASRKPIHPLVAADLILDCETGR
jgi:hypothetical protein